MPLSPRAEPPDEDPDRNSAYLASTMSAREDFFPPEGSENIPLSERQRQYQPEPLATTDASAGEEVTDLSGTCEAMPSSRDKDNTVIIPPPTTSVPPTPRTARSIHEEREAKANTGASGCEQSHARSFPCAPATACRLTRLLPSDPPISKHHGAQGALAQRARPLPHPFAHAQDLFARRDRCARSLPPWLCGLTCLATVGGCCCPT